MNPRAAISTAILAVMAGYAAVAPAVDFGNINLGDVQKVLGATQKVTTAMRDISPQEETEIGRGMAAGLLGAAPLLNDPEPAEYLDVTGNINATGVLKIDDVQVVSNRVIDSRISNTPNSGDANTDNLIDAIRDAMLAHGLMAAA